MLMKSNYNSMKLERKVSARSKEKEKQEEAAKFYL